MKIRGVLGNSSYQRKNKNEIVKHENSEKGGWIDNCQNEVSFRLWIGPKTLNPNMSFELPWNQFEGFMRESIFKGEGKLAYYITLALFK